MNNDKIIASRLDKINYLQTEMARFYGEPLDRALLILKSQGWTNAKIAQEVFAGEVSRQAVNLRFKRIGGEKK